MNPIVSGRTEWILNISFFHDLSGLICTFSLLSLHHDVTKRYATGIIRTSLSQTTEETEGNGIQNVAFMLLFDLFVCLRNPTKGATHSTGKHGTVSTQTLGSKVTTIRCVTLRERKQRTATST